ncbi:MAG TPA: PAS domain-containing sensor histidine kinase [Tenuifilaceae bacterium]|nr:PAS domain-containing sensor histidine kinase [Tenuifilaceae bacterium]
MSASKSVSSGILWMLIPLTLVGTFGLSFLSGLYVLNRIKENSVKEVNNFADAYINQVSNNILSFELSCKGIVKSSIVDEYLKSEVVEENPDSNFTLPNLVAIIARHNASAFEVLYQKNDSAYGKILKLSDLGLLSDSVKIFPVFTSDSLPLGVCAVLPENSYNGYKLNLIFFRHWQEFSKALLFTNDMAVRFGHEKESSEHYAVEVKRQLKVGADKLCVCFFKSYAKQGRFTKAMFMTLAAILSVLLIVLEVFTVNYKTKPLRVLLKKEYIALDEVNNNSATFEEKLAHVIMGMRVQIKNLTKQVNERDSVLSQFHQATTDGIVIHKGGMPLLINPTLEKITGLSYNELKKRNPYSLLQIDETTLQDIQDKTFTLFEAELRRANGKNIFVEVQKGRVSYHGQEAESLVIHDITHRKLMEKEIQQERARQVRSVIDGQEKERQRLSRELHDGLGQNLVAIKLKLESITEEKAGELSAILNQVKQMFNHTIEEVRRISNNLMPAALKEFSLAVVLRNLINEVESNSGVSVEFAVGIIPEPLDQLIKTYVYRIVQEALTNVVKHSGASRVLVSIYSDYSSLHLQIEDNGEGFDASESSYTGNGLYNMKERAYLLNGKINIISSKGKGVKIIAQFPLKMQKNSQNEQN